MSEDYVLDASAVLCLINGEPGADVVGNLLTDSVISAVNYSEVIAKLCERGLLEAEALDVVAPLRLRIVALDEHAALVAGGLRRATKIHGLSFGDRACLALCQSLQAIAVTTDRAWAEIADKIGVRIEMAR